VNAAAQLQPEFDFDSLPLDSPVDSAAPVPAPEVARAEMALHEASTVAVLETDAEAVVEEAR